MESWQEQRISKNIHKLVVNTKLHNGLISELTEEGVISGWDLKLLNSQDEYHDLERTLLLYNMILTSTSTKTYTVLVKALEKTDQTNALNILKQNDGNGLIIPTNHRNALGGASTDCTIDAVVEAMINSSVACILVNNWTSLGRQLRTPSFELAALRQDFACGRKTHQDVITELLLKWKKRSEEQATLDALVNVFKMLSWMHIADLVQKKFGMATA